MNVNVITKYLVSLGFETDTSAWSQFQQALNRAGHEVRGFTSGVSHEFMLAAGAVGGALTSIIAGTAALMDHTAQADLGYQVFARRMFMTADAGKQLKIATDALGYSLEDIIWGPKELSERYRQLITDQKELAKGLGGADFEKQTRQLRDLKFEYTRFKVELQYFTMNLTRLMSRALFGDDGGMLKRLQDFNKWFIENVPRISQQLTDQLGPAIKDIVAIGNDLWQVVKAVVSTFIAFTGQVANIDKLKSGQVTIDNLATATERWLHALRNIVDVIASIFNKLDALSKSPWNPTNLGGWYGDWLRKNYAPGGMKPIPDTNPFKPMAESRQRVMDMIREAARSAGVPENIALGMGRVESNYDQSARSNKGAVGVMQLMPDTARQLGVDPYSTQSNISGGLGYIRSLFDKYHDWRQALEAYNWGPGNMDRFRGKVPSEVQGYADRVMHEGDTHITVHVTQPNASAKDIALEVGAEQDRRRGRRTQAHLAQFSGGYS